jgi:hypothetical protein
MYRTNKRVSVREAFCPRGCKKGLDSIHHVGSGSCDDCVAFSNHGVLEQGITTARLILLEDERTHTASTKLIPTPPPSPGKVTREIMGTIKDAQKFVVNLLHQQSSGIRALNAVLLPDDDDDVEEQAAADHKRKKADERALAKKTKHDIETQSRKDAEANQFDFDDDVHTLLTKVLEVGQSISIRNIEGAGRGLFSDVPILQSQYICNYDGDRVDATTGQILMRCKRTSENIKKLPTDIQRQLRSLEYVKNWAVTLNRGSNIKSFGGTHNIVIDGTIAASPILDYLVDRGLIV